jgi:hypothetical protein
MFCWEINLKIFGISSSLGLWTKFHTRMKYNAESFVYILIIPDRRREYGFKLNLSK